MNRNGANARSRRPQAPHSAFVTPKGFPPENLYELRIPITKPPIFDRSAFSFTAARASSAAAHEKDYFHDALTNSEFRSQSLRSSIVRLFHSRLLEQARQPLMKRIISMMP
jgi:hypothetical protein